jgi:hypothetical protein
MSIEHQDELIVVTPAILQRKKAGAHDLFPAGLRVVAG